MLRVVELTKLYGAAGGKTGGGVRQVSFDIGAAEFFTLLGPSGCGKTTALRSIAGLEDPTAGRIEIDGNPVFDAARGVNVTASQRGIGMVFQSYAVWPHMTVQENVAFPLEMAKKRKYARSDVSRRVKEVLTTVGLQDYAGRSAHQLSGGQQQRLSLARALASEPALLLLDEPLSNLDALLRDQMRMELRRLQKEAGVATLYVTHDQSEALAMSDRIAVMRDGVIEQSGAPKEIYHAPVNRFVATFVGRTNIFAVKSYVMRGDDAMVETGFGSLRASRNEQTTVTPTAIAIRPEYVTLVDPVAVNGGVVNHLKGRIANVTFYGEAAEYHIRLSDGSIVLARVSPAGALFEQSDVAVYFPPEHVICLM